MTRPFPLARLALSTALLCTLLAAGVVTGSSASAHTPSASATCSTLSVSLQSYSWSESNPRPNRVTVTVDRGQVASESFGGSFTRDFPLGDSTRSHTWKVVIDAVDNGYDRTFEGTSTPCAPPVSKDAAAAVHTTPATCTSAGTLVLDGITNATWSTPTATQGPAAYSVTATATRGHAFPDGAATRVFTGTLPGALDSATPACVKPPVTPTPPRVTPPRVSPKPAPLELSARTVTISCEEGMIITTTNTTTTDWVPNAAGTGWVEGEPVVTTTNTVRRASPGDCPEVSDGGGGAGPSTPAPSVGGEEGGGAGGGGVGASVGSGLGFGLNALAHAGAEAASAISLAIALLAAGGILILRRRDAALGNAETQPTAE